MLKTFRHLLCLIVAASTYFSARSQSVSINTTGAVANTSAMLDVTSTTKGVLIPRMNKTQKNAITTPATGLLVYQTLPDSTGFHYYDGTTWIWLSGTSDSTAWKITGNNNITSSNFLGTTNDSALRLRIRNIPSGLLDSASANTTFGFRSNAAISTGLNNTFMGYNAGASTNTGNDNTTVGNEAGRFLRTNNNTAIGSAALRNDSTGAENVAVGFTSLYSIGTASGNTGLGAYSATYVTGGSNTYIGRASGYGSSGIATGTENTAVGYNTLFDIRSATRNIAIGLSALLRDSTGSNNVALGVAARQSNLRGGDNVTIGNFAGNNDTASNGTVVIGRRAAQSNQRDGIVAIGYQSLLNNSIGLTSATQLDSALYNTGVGYESLAFNTKGGWNTGVGFNAARSNLTGFYNTAVGVNALLNTQTADNNTAVGTSAGDTYNNGAKNTFIGSGSDVNAAGRINATAIGANALVAQDNSMVLGSINGTNGATASTRVGIGITAPTTTLDVRGNFLLGTNGTALNEIIKQTVTGTIPDIGGNGATNMTLTVPNATVGSTVMISPATVLSTGTTISYGFVSAANTVTVYVGNVTTAFIGSQPNISFNVTIIR